MAQNSSSIFMSSVWCVALMSNWLSSCTALFDQFYSIFCCRKSIYHFYECRLLSTSILCKLLSPIPFARGPFHLGRCSKFIDVIGIVWVIITVVLFVLPPEHPVTATNMNYTSLVFGTAVLAISLAYIFSARYWFKGPLTNVPTTIELKSPISTLTYLVLSIRS